MEIDTWLLRWLWTLSSPCNGRLSTNTLPISVCLQIAKKTIVYFLIKAEGNFANATSRPIIRDKWAKVTISKGEAGREFLSNPWPANKTEFETCFFKWDNCISPKYFFIYIAIYQRKCVAVPYCVSMRSTAIGWAKSVCRPGYTATLVYHLVDHTLNHRRRQPHPIGRLKTIHQ